MLAEESHDVPCLLLVLAPRHSSGSPNPWKTSFSLAASAGGHMQTKELVCWYLFVNVWILLNPGEFPPQSPQTVSLCMYLECRLSPWFWQIKSNSSDLTCKFGVWLTQYFRVKLTRKMLTEQASSVLQDSLSSFDYLCRRSDFLSGMFQPHYNKTSPWKQLLLAIQIREILDQVTDPPKQALLITQGFSIQP